MRYAAASQGDRSAEPQAFIINRPERGSTAIVLQLPLPIRGSEWR